VKLTQQRHPTESLQPAKNGHHSKKSSHHEAITDSVSFRINGHSLLIGLIGVCSATTAVWRIANALPDRQCSLAPFLSKGSLMIKDGQ